MHKKDFIQTASIEFLSQTNWDLDKSISYAERLWLRLSERGYGDPKQTGPRETKKGYDKLSPTMKAAFDLFWLAFDYKKGKDEAASAWLEMGEMNKNDYEPIILAAKQEAIDRKQLPEGQVAIMAQGWLNRRRYLDKQKTTVEQAKKQVDERKEKIQKLMGDLNHAQALADHTKQEFWLKEVQKISEQLNKLKAGQ